MTATTQSRPLSQAQINAIIGRVKEEFKTKFDQAEARQMKEQHAARKKDLEKVLASVQKQTRDDIIKRLMDNSCSKIAGVTTVEYRSAYSSNKPLSKYLDNLKFDLIMANVSGYEKIVAAFKEKLNNLIK